MPFDTFDDLPVEVRVINEAIKQFDDKSWMEARKIGGKHRCMRGYLCLARKALNVTGDRTDRLIQYAILLAGNKEATETDRVREVFFIARREGMNKRWSDRLFDLVVQQL
jgi:hypothetical protein